MCLECAWPFIKWLGTYACASPVVGLAVARWKPGRMVRSNSSTHNREPYDTQLSDTISTDPSVLTPLLSSASCLRSLKAPAPVVER